MKERQRRQIDQTLIREPYIVRARYIVARDFITQVRNVWHVVDTSIEYQRHDNQD